MFIIKNPNMDIIFFISVSALTSSIQLVEIPGITGLGTTNPLTTGIYTIKSQILAATQIEVTPLL